MARLAAHVLCIAALLCANGCGSDDADTTSSPATATPPANGAPSSSDDTKFPDIEKAELKKSASGYTVVVTVSSPYDSPERYADGWRVLKAGTEEELATHELAHDHASEQPFTREQSGLQIPDGIEQITIQGRDKSNGYGGDTITIDVPR